MVRIIPASHRRVPDFMGKEGGEAATELVNLLTKLGFVGVKLENEGDDAPEDIDFVITEERNEGEITQINFTFVSLKAVQFMNTWFFDLYDEDG